MSEVGSRPGKSHPATQISLPPKVPEGAYSFVPIQVGVAAVVVDQEFDVGNQIVKASFEDIDQLAEPQQEPEDAACSTLLVASEDMKTSANGGETDCIVLRIFSRVVHGLADNVFAMTSLVNLYAKCGMIDDAYKVFDRMPERDLVCWNTVISGFAQNGMPEMALELVVTLVFVLPACAALIDMYAKCGSVHSGRVVFDRMSSRSVVS
ncbi:hypothetical protein LIER_30920 [Lithospermum erythrorhizon]|uniref:Pentatricopeptide repeat-containing protein n=1 Tax=Lithospermum erythrorhizon TaxID=34254 RepID=A0AAV3RSH9_LITER